MPFAPNFRALSTSASVDDPSATNHLTAAFDLSATAEIDSVIMEGFSFETAFPEPISSGGSMAMKSGLKFAIVPASSGVLTQTIETICRFFKMLTNSRIESESVEPMFTVVYQ